MDRTSAAFRREQDPLVDNPRLRRLRAAYEQTWPCATYEACAAYDRLLARVGAEAGVPVPDWDTRRGGVWTAETRAAVERACREAGAFK